MSRPGVEEQASATPEAGVDPAALTVEDVDAALLRVPLRRGVRGASARAGVSPAPLAAWDVVVVRVGTRGGVEGLGFSYALRAGGEAVLAALRHDLAPAVAGADAWATERLWHRLSWATADVGRRGAYMHALSALDIALWDAKARAAGVSLARLLGADRTAVPIYESDSGWLSLSLDELVRESVEAVERGMRALKLMVGSADRREDARRVAAVRRAIGPAPLLMVDAGQRWSVATAVDQIRRLEEHDIHWVEEPLACDDADGHERLAACVTARIATGQSLTSRHEVAALLSRRAVDVVQVDAARVGGVSEWWRIAHLAETAGCELAPHFLPELHVSLAAASPVGAFVEHTPWLAELLDDPPRPAAGELVVPAGPGHGLRLREDAWAWRIA